MLAMAVFGVLPAYPLLPPAIAQEHGGTDAGGGLASAAPLAVDAHEALGAAILEGAAELLLQFVEDTAPAQQKPLS